MADEAVVGRALIELRAENAKLRKDLEDAQAGVKAAMSKAEREAAKVQKSIQANIDRLNATKATKSMDLLAKSVEQMGGRANLNAQQVANLTKQIERLSAAGAKIPKSLAIPKIGGADAGLKAAGASALSGLGPGGAIGAGLSALGPGGLAAGAVAAGIAAITTAFINESDALDELSKKTGLSIATLDAWGIAAKTSGVSAEQLAETTLKLSANIAQGDSVFARLGLRLDDLRKLTPEEQFAAVGQRILELKTPGEQAAAALETMGRDGTAALQALRDGFLGNLPAAKVHAEAMEDSRKEAAALKDDIDKLGVEWDRLKDNVAGVVVPGIVSALKLLRGAAVGAFKPSQLVGELISGVSGAALPDFGDVKGDATSTAIKPPPTFTSAAELARQQAEQKKLQEEAKRTAEAAKRAAEEISKLGRTFTGAIDPTQFAKVSEALGQIGSASDIADSQVEGLANQLMLAAEQGLPLPPIAEAIVQRWLEMQEAAAATERLNKALEEQKRIAGLLGPTVEDVKKKLDELSKAVINATEGTGELGRLSDSEFRAFAEAVSKADTEARALTDDVTGLSLSISQISGGNITLSSVFEEAANRGIELDGTLSNVSAGTKEATKEGYNFSQALEDAANAAQALGVNMDSTLGRMIVGLQQAFAAAQRVSGAIAATATRDAQGNITKKGSFGQLSTGGKVGVGLEGLNVIGGILQGRQQGQSRGSSALQGAAKGAAFGTAILPGWGTAIGAVAGGVLGLFAKSPAWEKAAQQAGKILGREVPQDMAEQILAEAEKSGKSVAEVAQKIKGEEDRAKAVEARAKLEEGLNAFASGLEQANDALKDVEKSPALEAALGTLGAKLDEALGKAGLFRTPEALKESKQFGAVQQASVGLATAAAGARQAGVLDTEVQAALGTATKELQAVAVAAAKEAGLSDREAQRAGFGAVSGLLREQLNSQLQANGKVDAALQAQLDEAKANGIEILADPAIDHLNVAKQQLDVLQQGFGIVADKVDQGAARTVDSNAALGDQIGAAIGGGKVEGGAVGGAFGHGFSGDFDLGGAMPAGLQMTTPTFDLAAAIEGRMGGILDAALEGGGGNQAVVDAIEALQASLGNGTPTTIMGGDSTVNVQLDPFAINETRLGVLRAVDDALKTRIRNRDAELLALLREVG